MVGIMSDLLAEVRAEIEERLRELRPLVSEYERMLDAADALGIGPTRARAPSPPRVPPRVAQRSTGAAQRDRGAAQRDTGAAQRDRGAARRDTGAARRDRGAGQRNTGGKPARARRGAAEHAIVAALEHGSHTVSELVVVTAMSGPNIRSNLRRLLRARTVTQTKREGKAAYALSSPSD